MVAIAAFTVPDSPKSFSARETSGLSRSLSGLLSDWSADRPALHVWISSQSNPKSGDLIAVSADAILLAHGDHTTVIPLTGVLVVSLWA